MNADKNEIERISAEIQKYLHNHPNAADTLEGITRWWITRQRYEETTIAVKTALEDLINQGVVKKSINLDKRHIYSKGKTSAF